MERAQIDFREYMRRTFAGKFAFLKDPHSLFYYVLLLIFCGFLFFGFALVTQSFTTPYGGDFAMQGMTFSFNFYDSWWTFLKTGRFPHWDENVYLGADNIAANTFYGLFSPFTLPLLLFPREWVPHVMALLSIARLVVGGIFFRLYLRSLGVKEDTARLFSLAYAFSGWIAFYLWFNSFYEVLTFFPLVFYGIERLLKERKVWPLAVGLFLIGISNYFYFLTVGIFGVLYSGFRYFQTLRTRTPGQNAAAFFLGFTAFAVGFGLTAFVTLPAIMASFSIPRAAESTYWQDIVYSFQTKNWHSFFGYLFYDWDTPYQVYYPIISFFYPTVSCRFVSLLEKNFDNVSSGLYMFSPSIVLFFVSMYLSLKERKISHFIAIAFLASALFFPFLYYLIGGFSVCYGRWEIVIPTFALAYVALYFDKRKEVPPVVVVISGTLTFLFTLGDYFLAESLIKKYASSYQPLSPMGWKIGLVAYQLILVLVTVLLLTGFWRRPKKIHSVLTGIMTVEIAVMGTLVANFHGLSSYRDVIYGGRESFAGECEVVRNLIEDDRKRDGDTFYRIFSTTATDYQVNLPEAVGYNGMTTFHTFFNNETYDFSYMSGLMNENGWGGGAYSRRYDLGQFLGVKYFITRDAQTTYSYRDAEGNLRKIVYEPNVPLGYRRIDDPDVDDGFRVYENDHHVDFGISYDTLYYKGNTCAGKKTNSFYSNAQNYIIRNEEAYFKGAILNNDDVHDVADAYPGVFTLEKNPPPLEAKPFPVKVDYYLGSGAFQPGDPYRYLTPEYRTIYKNPLTYEERGKYMIAVSPRDAAFFPSDPEGVSFLLNYPLKNSWLNFDATVFMIARDEDDKPYVTRYDNLNWTTQRIYAGTSSTQFFRGLYATERIEKLIIVVNGDQVYQNVKLYYRPFKDQLEVYDGIQGVSDAHKKVDEYTFRTDYEKPRFLITQIAYAEGWSVEAVHPDGTSEECRTYNSQGGFVGFVASAGEMSYVMRYKTPYEDYGIAIAAVSLATLIVIVAADALLEKRRRKRPV